MAGWLQKAMDWNRPRFMKSFCQLEDMHNQTASSKKDLENS